MSSTRGCIRRPRLGHTSFLDCVPLFWGIARTAALLDLDLVRDTPDKLTERLLAGDLDVAAVPSLDCGRHCDELVVLPGIAAGSDGPMASCILVTKLPLEELDGKTVALASTSRSSARLTRLLLEHRYHVTPRYLVMQPDLGSMLRDADAAVIIGDLALQVALHQVPVHGHVHDLGELWKQWTGLPFVFGLWTARRDFAVQYPEAVDEVHRALLTARDLARAEATEVAERSAQWEAFDAMTLEHYFTQILDYSLGPRQLAGLAEFGHRTGHGALDAPDGRRPLPPPGRAG